MFEHDRQNIGTPVIESVVMKVIKKNEDAFYNRMMIKDKYGVDCSKLTLWEYFLLIEKITSENSKT